MTVLYSCVTFPGGLRFVKWDEDMNPAAEYTCQFQPSPGSAKGDWMCSCPAGPRPSCKHRRMIPRFMLANRHNTQWFHCYETNTWHMPFPTLDEGNVTGEKAAHASEAREPGGHLQPPPHSPTVTTTGFDPVDAGSIPAAAATTTAGIRRR